MIYHGMSNADYHSRNDSISKTGLDLIARSPAHFRYAPRKEPTRAMTIGSATHAAILEPAAFREQFVIVPVDDRRSSVWKEAIKTKGEEFCLTQTEADRIVAMQEAVNGNQHMRALLSTDGEAEVSFFTTDPVTGVKVRARFDWLTASNRAVDLKTAADASDDAFGKSIVNYRYHVQQAFYADVFKWETGETLADWSFAVVESDAPHCTAFVRLPDDVVEYGRKLYRADLNRYADCLARDEWPGIDGSPHMIAMPGWFIAQMDNEMAGEIA